MQRAITIALMIVGVIAWAYKKYGLLAMVTRKVAKHAAVGRAKYTWFWNVPVRDHKGIAYSASDLVARLRAERAELLAAASRRYATQASAA